nr:DUF6270 domain-containing protein [Actinomyces naeslundii]
MANQIRVAVCGACPTRDLFNSIFVPDYKENFRCVATSYRVSPISLMSKPVPFSPLLISDLAVKAQQDMKYEFGRYFLADLIKANPDVLVFDFSADVRHGCVELYGRYVATRNRWRLVKTELFRSHKSREIVPGTLEYFYLWDQSIRRLVELVRICLPSCRIVLHEVRNCYLYRDTGGRLLPFVSPSTLARQNRWWDVLNKRFKRLHADAVIDVFDSQINSCVNHPWGPWPAHYELGYHRKAVNRLIDIMAIEN